MASAIVDAQSFPFDQEDGRKLWGILSDLYPTESTAVAFGEKFGIKPNTLKLNVSVEDLWKELLQKLASAGQTRRLVDAAVKEKSGNSSVPFLKGLLDDRLFPDAFGTDEPSSRVERYLLALERELEYVTAGVGQDHRLIDVFVAPHLTNRTQQQAIEWPNLDWQRPIALVGTAGAGKSTLLRHLAYKTAEACRLAGATLKNLRASSHRVPFLVDLHKVSNFSADQISALDFLTLLKHPELTPDDVKQILKDGDALLLFDKFDEVSDETSRERLAGAVRGLQGGGKRANGIVLASRKRTWTTKVASGFVQITVQPLEPDQIETIIQKSLSENPGAVARVLKTLRSSPRVRRIATNPQMLSMLMVVLQEGAARDLTHRVLVYEECIRRLTVDANRFVRWSADDVARMLTALALAMRRANEPRLDLGRARQALKPFDKFGEAKHLLENLERSTGLIVADPRYQVVFVHQTFQEYLVAREYALTDAGWQELLPNVEDPTWSETLALVAGVLADQEPERLPAFLEKILAAPSPKPGEELSPEMLVAWAPRVAAASVCFIDLRTWDLGPDALEPVHRAHQLILPVLESDQIDIRHKVDIATGLGAVEDPRLQQERWIPFETADTVIGSDAEEAWPQERPAHRVTVPAVWMQRWPVTVGEYRHFIHNDGYTDKRWWDNDGLAWLSMSEHHLLPDRWEEQQVGNHPVTGISYWEACAYCRWFSSLGGIPDGWTVRLPTEAEWERAARGANQLADQLARFPWGPEWHHLRANSEETSLGIVPVGIFIAARHGLWDLAGNVIERCLDRFLPYDARPTVNLPVEHVIRGGSYLSGPLDLRVSVRNALAPGKRQPDVGFRCAAGPVLADGGGG